MSSTTSQQTDPQSVIDDLRVLLARNVQDNLRLAQRFGGLIKDATEQFGVTAKVGGLPRSNDLLARWLDLNFAFYSSLTNHGVAFLDDLLSAAAQNLGVRTMHADEAAAPESQARTAATPVSRLELNLSARIGEMAIAPFVIDNQESTQAEISFHASDFISSKGETVLADGVSFDPARLSLGSKEQAIVKAIVTTNDSFRVGETYVTTVSILGFQAKQIILVLTILSDLEPKSVRKTQSRKSRASSAKKSKKRAVKP